MLQYKQAFTSFPTSALPPIPRPPGELSAAEPEIDTMILLDRGIDMVTPLVLPLTYEALVDHIIGIDTGEVTAHDPNVSLPVFLSRCVGGWGEEIVVALVGHIIGMGVKYSCTRVWWRRGSRPCVPTGPFEVLFGRLLRGA